MRAHLWRAKDELLRSVPESGNSLLAAERARKRETPLAATEKELER